MNRNVRRVNPTVYSTEQGRICPGCGKPVAECTCKKAAPALKGDGIIRISLQTKGRKGKKVTVLTGFSMPEVELGKLATELKRKCGAGGSVEGNAVEIQGDFRQKIAMELTGAGFKVKQVGG